jgi:phage terminase large subunit GpA-like protein
MVGETAASHNAMRIAAAEVDHGNDTATPIANQSASRRNRGVSRILA